MTKRITLTFDNGPHETGTPEVLDVLAARSLKATFFMVGSILNDAHLLKLAERIYADGHRVGNHTFSHGVPLGRRPGRETAEAEIGNTQRLIGHLSGERLFRPNGEKGRLGPHLLSQEAVNYLQTERYTVVIWNCVPEDWTPPQGSWVERARSTIGDLDWPVIVLHDKLMAGNVGHLEDFLDDLIHQGYEFTTQFPPDTLLMFKGEPSSALAGNFTATKVP